MKVIPSCAKKCLSSVALIVVLFGFASLVDAREQNFSPATGDILAKQGFERAITTEEGGVVLLYADGSKAKDFPLFVDGQVVASSPLLVDVVGDAYAELVFVTRKSSGAYSLFVYDGTKKLVGSTDLGSDLIYYDPVSVLVGDKSDIIVANTKGVLTKVHVEVGGLTKATLKNAGAPVGITAKKDGKEILLTYPEKNKLEMYGFDGKKLSLKKSITTDSPYIFPATYGEQGKVVYGVNKKQEVVAINLSDGKKVNGFPAKLSAEPVGSPALAEIDAKQTGKEIVVSLSDGTKKTVDTSGADVTSKPVQESYANPSVAVEEPGGGFFSGIRHFAINIVKSTQRTLVSFFGRLRAIVYVASADMQVSSDNEQIQNSGSLSFPTTDLGKSSTKTVTISNVGDGNLSLTGSPVVSVSGASEFTVTSQPKKLVTPGQSTTFDVTFKPSGGPNKVATLLIENSDKNKSPFKITLSGAGNVINVTLTATPTTGNAPLGVVFSSTASGGGNVSVPQSIDFSKYTISSSGGSQDSSNKYVLAQNGTEIDLSGSTSKYIDYLKDISSDTMLDFSFKSTKEGELHGIGITTDQGYTFFQLAGSEINMDGILEFYDYGGNDWKLYSIPVGNYVTGKITKLTFVSGANSGDLSVNSMFRDVKVFGANDAGYSYTWDFENDGNIDLSGNDVFEAYHQYTKPGVYTASLVVSDGKISINELVTITVK